MPLHACSLVNQATSDLLANIDCCLPAARQAAEADEEEQVRKKLRISPEDVHEFQRLDLEAKAKTARMQIDCNGLASAQQAGLAFAPQDSVQGCVSSTSALCDAAHSVVCLRSVA